MSSAGPSLCLYTVLLGGYEQLNEQPAAVGSATDLICFTDDPTLQSETWEVRQVQPILPSDPTRSHRNLKLRAHLLLPDHEVSLYIDNSVVLKVPAEQVVAELLPADAPLAMLAHSFRDSLADEFAEVLAAGYDTRTRCEEQIAHYLADDPTCLDLNPVIWGGMLARRHHHPLVVAAMETWWLHVLRYSRRDQLSIWFALRQTGLVPILHGLDNHESEYHMWPVATDRDRALGGRLWNGTEVELARLKNRFEELEHANVEYRQALAATEHELVAIRATRTWRWSRFARTLRARTAVSAESPVPTSQLARSTVAELPVDRPALGG